MFNNYTTHPSHYHPPNRLRGALALTADGPQKVMPNRLNYTTTGCWHPELLFSSSFISIHLNLCLLILFSTIKALAALLLFLKPHQTASVMLTMHHCDKKKKVKPCHFFCWFYREKQQSAAFSCVFLRLSQAVRLQEFTVKIIKHFLFSLKELRGQVALRSLYERCILCLIWVTQPT